MNNVGLSFQVFTIGAAQKTIFCGRSCAISC